MAILDQIGLDLGQGNTDYYLADAQARANEAADYDSTATYAVNDLCLYEGVLKQCTTAIPVAEAWDATHWRTVTIGGQIVALRAPFTGATDNTDGASGLVPPPSRGDQNKFLCANGLWVTISAGGTSLGFLPLIATLTAQDWVESSGNYVARIHDTAIISQMTVTGVNFDNAVNVPARVNVVVDGANHDVVLTTTEAPSVSVVAYIALTTDGSTVMEDVSELTTPFIGATSSTDGRQGLAPKPFIADKDKFLKGDGNWSIPQASEVAYNNTTVGAKLGDLNDQKVNQDSLAFIVNGDNAPATLPVGAFAFIRNNTHGLSDGLYKVINSAFPTGGGTAADSTHFRPELTKGALNSLQIVAKAFDTSLTANVQSNITIDLSEFGFSVAPTVINLYPIFSEMMDTNSPINWYVRTSTTTSITLGLKAGVTLTDKRFVLLLKEHI